MQIGFAHRRLIGAWTVSAPNAFILPSAKRRDNSSARRRRTRSNGRHAGGLLNFPNLLVREVCKVCCSGLDRRWRNVVLVRELGGNCHSFGFKYLSLFLKW